MANISSPKIESLEVQLSVRGKSVDELKSELQRIVDVQGKPVREFIRKYIGRQYIP